MAGAGRAISAIDEVSVHRICSGQVIVSIAVAVKELLENAVDAGALTVGTLHSGMRRAATSVCAKKIPLCPGTLAFAYDIKTT